MSTHPKICRVKGEIYVSGEYEALPDEDMELPDAVAEEYNGIEGIIAEPKTRAELEHNAYLRLMHEYELFLHKRDRCRRTGLAVIVLTALLFLVMMFSLESKILFLVLWVVSIFVSVFVIIRIDYYCYKYATILGIKDEGKEGEQI